MNRVKIICSVIVCIAILSGCATAPTGELKEVVIMNNGQSVATDARLRMVTHIKPGMASRPGRVDPNVITCTEPSPDVAGALARAGGFGVSVLNYGSASLSGSQVESVAQLAERTTAIQALLHQGYQACLDYANGAITGTTYSLRTSRLDDLLVTLILGEVAGGAFGRAGAAIGTKASSEAQAKLVGFPEMLKDLGKAKTELDAAEQKEKEKEKAYKDAEKAYNDSAAGDQNKENLKKDRDAKKAELEAATAEKNAVMQKLSTQLEASGKSAAEVNQLMAMGSLTQKPDPEIAKIIGEMHKRFIEKEIEQSYVSACLTELGSWKLESLEDESYARRTIDQLDEFKQRALLNKEQFNMWINETTSRPFFLASALNTKGTLLSTHCLENLEQFIRKTQGDRHALKLKALEIESRKLDMADSQTEDFSKKKEAIFPTVAFNLLKKDIAELENEKNKLEKEDMPKVSDKTTKNRIDELSAKKTTLINKANSVLQAGNSLVSATEEKEIAEIENRYVPLMRDPRMTGTQTEKRLWAAEYNLQQTQAGVKNLKLQSHSKNVKEVIKEIKAFEKQLQI